MRKKVGLLAKNKANQPVELASARPIDSRVAGQALLMSTGTFSSRVLGVARESLLAAFFDRTLTDAWITAFRVPNFFRRLLGEGSLSVSFIPVFMDARAQDLSSGQEISPRATNLVNGTYTLLLLILSTLTVLGVLFPEFFLSILIDVESFKQIPGKFELTLRMARIMFSFVFFISSFAYFMGILNALGKFGWAALAPLFFNVAMIVSTLLPAHWFPQAGDGLAWGVVVGGALQAGILLPQLKKLNYFPQLTANFWTADIKRVFRNMIPGLFGMSLMQITLLVNTRFASSLAEGAISYIHWADRLLELPLSLISVSLGTALLPTLTRFWSQGEKQEFSRTGNFYLRLNLYLSLACAIVLYTLARPIVEILFQRGKFTSHDTTLASQVLWVYAFAMIPTSGVRILGPFYFAVKNTWYPALMSLLGLILHVIMAPILMQHYGLMGLNISSMLSALLNFTLLLIGLPKLTTHFEYGKLVLQFLKFILAGAGLALGLQSYFLLAQSQDSLLWKIFSLLVAFLAGGILFVCLSRLLKLEEYETTVHRLWQKVAGKFGSRR